MSAVLSEDMLLELGLGRCVGYLRENFRWEKGVHGATEEKNWGQTGVYLLGKWWTLRQGSEEGTRL